MLGAGIYFTLSGVLCGNPDDSLKTRADQLSGFRDIMSIVSSGTFEEEIGELISFYFYSEEQLMHILPTVIICASVRDYPKNKIPGICEKEKIKSRGDFIFSFPHSSVPPEAGILFWGKSLKRFCKTILQIVLSANGLQNRFTHPDTRTANTTALRKYKNSLDRNKAVPYDFR